jgi:hypothetical protein
LIADDERAKGFEEKFWHVLEVFHGILVELSSFDLLATNFHPPIAIFLSDFPQNFARRLTLSSIHFAEEIFDLENVEVVKVAVEGFKDVWHFWLGDVVEVEGAGWDSPGDPSWTG